MDFKKYYRRRMKRLKAGFRRPFEQSKTLQKLWRLMGAKGVLLHMGLQGQWNPWVAFVLALASLAVVFGLIAITNALQTRFWGTYILVVPAVLSTYIHFALWRAARKMRDSLGSLVLKLYTIPMLGLMFFLMLAIVVVSLNEFLEFLFEAINGKPVLPHI